MTLAKGGDLARISIHALREEGDLDFLPFLRNLPVFLSTPSARRATPFGEQLGDDVVISIHALREEGDSSALSRCAAPAEFLSTPSARRATV